MSPGPCECVRAHNIQVSWHSASTCSLYKLGMPASLKYTSRMSSLAHTPLDDDRIFGKRKLREERPGESTGRDEHVRSNH